jgi:lipopolysaccharide biosynthesis protein
MYLSHVVVTGPVRSSDDIAADRKAANTFFTHYATPGWKKSRDLARLVEFYSHDWNLICCTIEAKAWSFEHGHDNAATRVATKAARATAEALDAIP